MKVDGGAVVVTFSPSWIDGEPLVVNLDPQNLPGRPADEFVIPLVADPQWISDWSDLGVVDDEYNVYIDSAVITEGYDGELLIRVYIDFTNNSAEETSCFMALYPSAYQDGVGLVTGYPMDDVAEDDLYYEDVAPGATVHCSIVWELRSTSPVEIEIPNMWADGGVGCIFSFTE